MAKMRVYELSKELDIPSKEILEILAKNGIEVKAASSNIEDDAIAIVRNASKSAAPAPKKEEKQKEEKPKEDKAKEEKTKKEKPAAKQVAEKTEAPKKKNISVVFNAQHSNTGGGRAQKQSGQSGRGPVRPGDRGGVRHTIIRPRPESERTVRPSDRRAGQAETDAPVDESITPDITEQKKTEKSAERPAARSDAPAARSASGSHIEIRRNIYDRMPQGRPASGGVRRAPSDRPGGGTRFAGQRPAPGQGRRPGAPQPAASNAPAGGAPARNGRGRADGGKNKRNQDRDQIGGKKQEQFRNLEKADRKKKAKPQSKPVRDENEILTLTLPEHLTIKELAEKMLVEPSAIIKKLFMKGTMATVNQSIDYETAEEIALEFNCVCEPEEKVDLIAEILKEDEEDPKDLVARPPVVCVMGHVDHGKTSLLDAIRDTHVTDREAGGITQKIGAYVVSINNQKITFLDTPGHEAFTAMRMRGANSTDIAILVVAADDGVMPQTVEAINHAKAAGVEIIVAINKIDKPNANVDRVKQELSEYELVPEDWGGSTIFVPVSAHSHEGIDQLLEMILLTAEVLELKANPKRNARGLVLEAELDKGRGVVATVLVQKGTLNVGDPVVAGSSFGKVRAMIDENGRRLKKAGPSTPVEILGLSEVPNAGEIFMSMDSEKDARSVADTFITVGKDKLIEESRTKMSLDDLFSQIQAGNLKELNIIVKADVQGSVEAVRTALEKLSNDEVVVKVLHGGVGAINESDVVLASASNAIIIGFNVRPDNAAKQTADQEGVDVRLYKVIYNAIEDVEAAMKGMLEPVYEEQILGHAEVRQIFKSSDVGAIAGSYITDGLFRRDCKVRVMRGEEQIFEGNLASLKRFKDDVKEVKTGYECGLVVEGFGDYIEGDTIEAYDMVEVPRK